MIVGAKKKNAAVPCANSIHIIAMNQKSHCFKTPQTDDILNSSSLFTTESPNLLVAIVRSSGVRNSRILLINGSVKMK